jgi:tRNA modification GTPase
MSIEGIPVTLTDTAGIRKSAEPIEQEGMAFVWEKTLAADIVLILIDGSATLTEDDLEIIDRNKGKQVLLVVNKSDLTPRIDGQRYRNSPPTRCRSGYRRNTVTAFPN